MIRPLDEQAARAVLSNLGEWGKREAAAGYGPDFVEPIVAVALQQARGWTYSLNGEPVAVSGATIRGDLLSHFTLATPKLLTRRLGLTRFVVSTIMRSFADSTASRAECLSVPGNATVHEWLKRLGGQPVEYMTGVGRQGEDMVRWRWIREDVSSRHGRRSSGR